MLFRSNHIIHRVNIKPSFQRWMNYYIRDLVNIYTTFLDCLKERYPENDIEWESRTFNSFCYIIYNKSSKFIFKD